MAEVQLNEVTKTFGSFHAVKNVSLQFPEHTTTCLLGPSGCGKSTLLRMIAGLETPTSGRILFDDRDVTSLGTEKRNAVMCFQSYALWPHMSVRENIRFGLEVRRLDRVEQDRRLDE